MNQTRHGGTVQGSAPRNPAIKDATAVKLWSFTKRGFLLSRPRSEVFADSLVNINPAPRTRGWIRMPRLSDNVSRFLGAFTFFALFCRRWRHYWLISLWSVKHEISPLAFAPR